MLPVRTSADKMNVEKKSQGLSLPGWLADRMVIQCGMPVRIEGSAVGGAKIILSFAGQRIETQAGDDGNWSAVFAPFTAGTEGDLSIVGAGEENVFHGVIAGEVWLCGGQSNMAMAVDAAAEAEIMRAWAGSANIRYCPAGGEWQMADSDLVGRFSAVGWSFAFHLQSMINVPVGIICAARGGTGIEAWLAPEAFPDTPRARALLPLINDPEVMAAAEADRGDFRQYGNHRLGKWGLGRAMPGELFRQLLEPLAGIPLRGVVWYQGENAAATVQGAWEYLAWLRQLICCFRVNWKQLELPFVLVQLPGYDPGKEVEQYAWAWFRDIQTTAVRTVHNTALTCIADLGDRDDIHPRCKLEVGRRVALSAGKLTYHRHFSDEFTPEIVDVALTGDVVELTFAEGGDIDWRRLPDGSLTGFELAGPDEQYFPAIATVDGKTVRIAAVEVNKPYGLRYGWSNYPILSIYSSGGLPLPPFQKVLTVKSR